jgi:hypothetical protein
LFEPSGKERVACTVVPDDVKKPAKENTGTGVEGASLAPFNHGSSTPN